MYELANLLTMAFTNPEQFARFMQTAGVQPPGTPGSEWEGLLGSGGRLGQAFQGGPGYEEGAVPPGTFSSDTPPPPGPLSDNTYGETTPPPGQFNPGTPGMDNPETLDINRAIQDRMPPPVTPPGGPGGPNGQAKTPPGQNRRWPQVQMPQQQRPIFSGGVAGAQKAPDFGVQARTTPAQQMMQILLGGQQGQGGGRNALRVPDLGSLFRS